MAEKTADNFGNGNMSAEYRMKYKKMLEAHDKKEKDGVEQNVELHITAMGIEPFDKSGDQAEGLYGEKAATPPPKAQPVADTSTYLA